MRACVRRATARKGEREGAERALIGGGARASPCVCLHDDEEDEEREKEEEEEAEDEEREEAEEEADEEADEEALIGNERGRVRAPPLPFL